MSDTATQRVVGAGASASVLSLDLETRSTVDLKKVGVYRYAMDPTTDAWCMAFAFDDEDVQLWTPQARTPVWEWRRVLEHIAGGGEMRAHNAQFERVIWNLILHRRYGFPRVPREQWHCTAAEAAAMALPRQLKKLSDVLQTDERIDDTKNRLILQMAKPRKPRKGEDGCTCGGGYWTAGGICRGCEGTLLWWDDGWDDEERLHKLYEACKQDVRVERACAKKVRRLSKMERSVYLLDQLANDRGVHLDVPLVQAAVGVADIAVHRANEELVRITNGEVNAVTNHTALTRWLNVRDPSIESVAKDKVRDLLGEDDLTPEMRDALTIRQEVGKSSIGKLSKMLEVVSWKSKLRGLTLYHGAGTGRSAGKLVQPHNFPRGNDVRDVQSFIERVLAGDIGAIEADQPAMIVLSAMLRSMMTASPNCRLVSADYGQIEARVLAWIAGQKDLVELFRIGPGRRVYKNMSAMIQSKKEGRTVDWTEIDEHSEVYIVGKNTILGAGYQLSWPTFQKQTHKNLGVWIPDEDAKLGIEVYRAQNRNIVQFWYDTSSAAIEATAEPGKRVQVGRGAVLTWLSTGDFLWCILPSKRALCYTRPKVEYKMKFGRERATLTFEGSDSYTKQWKRHDAYGGLLTNNVVQAMARDLMVLASLRVEARGYPYVLSVHDEVVCDVPEGHGSLDEFVKLMTVLPRWAEGLPIAADGWEGHRYRK